MFNNNENGALVRPDVSKMPIEKSLQTKINWVGMDEIRMPYLKRETRPLIQLLQYVPL